MTEQQIDEVMDIVDGLVIGSRTIREAKEAIRAKLREVARKPLSDIEVSLLAHNLDEGDWDSLVNRNCWLGGFQQGFRESEKHHQIGAE